MPAGSFKERRRRFGLPAKVDLNRNIKPENLFPRKPQFGVATAEQVHVSAHRDRIATAIAAAVGDATARALAYETRINDCYFYPNSAWLTPFPGGSYKFEDNGGAVNLNAKAMFFFYATGVTPAMTEKMVGEGSQYAGAFVDAKGNPLDGSKTYSVHMPPNIPAKDFWSYTSETFRHVRSSSPIGSKTDIQIRVLKGRLI